MPGISGGPRPGSVAESRTVGGSLGPIPAADLVSHPPESALPAGASSISHLAVVIPVHNEERHLARALEGVSAAVDHLAEKQPGVRTRLVLVLDSCSDGSASVARRYAERSAAAADVTVLAAGFKSVGRSRRAGIHALWNSGSMAAQAATTSAPFRDAPAGRTWLANTDADSLVPRNWLLRQVELAAAGADAVLGSVEPDPDGMDPALLQRWRARHPFRENHPHVYGANLGVRASAYLAAGGFPAADSGEDRALASGLRRSGANVVATDSIRVRTSGRTAGRAPRGFGAYLLALALEPPPGR